jgi:hypothetical protein
VAEGPERDRGLESVEPTDEFLVGRLCVPGDAVAVGQEDVDQLKDVVEGDLLGDVAVTADDVLETLSSGRLLVEVMRRDQSQGRTLGSLLRLTKSAAVRLGLP